MFWLGLIFNMLNFHKAIQSCQTRTLCRPGENARPQKTKRGCPRPQSLKGILLMSRRNRKPVSVLSCHLSAQPTPWQGRAAPEAPKGKCQYIWSCRPWCRTRQMSPPAVVSSCLTFSPLPLRAVIFCYGIRKITPTCAFHSRVPFPVRTFLTHTGATGHSAFIIFYIRACAQSCHSAH